MKLFVASSYSSKVNYDTGQVFPEYVDWHETQLRTLEKFGHQVFSALRHDAYTINDSAPEEAFRLDYDEIEAADGMIAFLDSSISAGIHVEIGIAVALKKRLVLARIEATTLPYFDNALVRAQKATSILLPLERDPFAA